jgi:hypothetical protein
MKWEYLVAFVDSEYANSRKWFIRVADNSQALEEGLRALGEAGWELAAVHERWSPGGSSGPNIVPAIYLFKRPR